MDTVSLPWQSVGARMVALTLYGKVEVVRGPKPGRSGNGLTVNMGWVVYLKGKQVGWEETVLRAMRFASNYVAFASGKGV